MTVKDRNWFICLDSTMYYMLVSSKVSWQHSWRTGLSYQGCCTLGLDEAEGLRVGWVHAAELEGVGRGRWQGTPVRTRACLWAQAHVSPEQTLRDCMETGSRYGANLKEVEKQRTLYCRLCSIIAEPHDKTGRKDGAQDSELFYEPFWFHSEFL